MPNITPTTPDNPSPGTGTNELFVTEYDCGEMNEKK